jgi:predicted HTH transcriptional regulator
MNAAEVLTLAANGENSRVQFKENVTNAVSIEQEMVAFSNSKGGILLVGINDCSFVDAMLYKKQYFCIKISSGHDHYHSIE